MTQIINPCHLLPRSFGVQSVFQTSQSSGANVGSKSSLLCLEVMPWHCWVRLGRSVLVPFAALNQLQLAVAVSIEGSSRASGWSGKSLAVAAP